MKEKLFEEDYFSSTYQGNYLRRNPPYKWVSFLGKILKHRQQGSLLDIGCGWGLFLKQAQYNFDCTGCDISTYALDKARQALPGSVQLFQGSLGELSPGSTYDVITCFDVIEHVSDLDKVWANLADLMKPRGLLIVTVPVYDGPIGKLVNYMDKDQTHIHRRERIFWVKQIRENFLLLENIGIWRFYFLNNFYLNIVSSISRHITPAIMLISEKP
jgi:SAM-dependent methyltransferase